MIIKISMWLAAPIVICMFITEFGIALISRAAPQLNVFILAMPIKSAVALMILTVYITTMFTLVRQHLMDISLVFDSLGIIWR